MPGSPAIELQHGDDAYSKAYPYPIDFPAEVEQFSFKAIDTKTLAVQTYNVVFSYSMGLGTSDFTRTIKVAPVTGSFLSLPGESEGFHYGTRILDVSVGNARLVVPIGCTLDWIGAAFVDKVQDVLRPSVPRRAGL